MALTIDQLDIQIAAESKTATTALDALIAKLEKLYTKLNALDSAANKASSANNKVTQSTNNATAATNKYTTATTKSTQSTKSFSDTLARNISKWRTLFGVFKSAANMMGSWFNESNEYIETLNLFNVTMGDAADAAYKYAESVHELVGIDIEEWMNYQGTFKNLTAGFGVAEESANTMSQNLTQLSYDMASFFNTDVETAFDKLSSAMAGQVKGLREFGIDTTVASLQEYALAKGIDKSVRSMTQAEKSLLRYNYIMEKSVIMQGDMARTIVTPANALRILNAQLTQMKRALGNIISVLVAEFIPYVQATVRVITDAANAIATFFGFELPTIDYSGLDTGGFADDLEDAEDATSGTADTLKKIKKQLMGFDELNIINNPDTDSGSTSGSGTDNSVLNMEPLEYDFLAGLDTSKADEIYDKVKKFLSPLKKVWNYLVDYEDTLKAIAGVIAGIALVKWIKNVGKALSALQFVSYFLDGFTFIKAVGGNFFQNFRGGLDMIRQNLTGIQKAGLVAAAGVIEFVAIKDSVRELALGCEDVGAKIVTIGVVAAAAGVAMYTALGPWGLALAAVVAIAGAIAGVGEAAAALRDEFVETTVFNNYGIAIGEITGILENLWSSISVNANLINEIGDKVKANDEVITESQTGITTYMTNLTNAGTITADQAQAMSEDVANLAASIKENLGYNTEIIFTAFSNISKETAKQLGMDVGEMTGILNTFKQTFSEKTSELESTSQQYLTRLANGEILSEEELQEFNETLSYLSDMSGKTYENQEKVKRAMSQLTDVNFGSVEESQKAIEQMTQLGIDMNADLDTAYTTALTSIDTMMGQAKTMLEHGDLTQTAYNNFAEVMKNYKEGITVGYEQNKADIESQMNTVFGYIEGQINQAGLDLYDESLNNFENLSWWEKIWYGGDRNKYAGAVMQDFKDDISDPLYEALTKSYNELGLESTGAGKEIMDNFFTSIGKAASDAGTTSGAIVKEQGLNAIKGYRNSITENTKSVTDAFKTMTQSGIDAVVETQDSHSPAKEYEKLALYAIQGYAGSIDDNFYYIENAFVENFKRLFADIKRIVSNSLKDVSNVTNNFSVTGFTKSLDSITSKAKSVFGSSTWTSYANNVTNALARIKVPTFKNIGLSVSFDSWVSSDKEKVYKALGLSGWPYLNWYTYAQGGFPDMGQMFIAREAGPELVGNIGRKTAVANNDQIVSGIEAGVYRAMMAANSGNKGGTLTIRLINEIDGAVVGEKVIQYHNGKVMQTGVSPLLV